MRRLVIGSLIALAVAYAGVCAAIWYKQGDFIFYPSRTVGTTPADFGARFERVVLALDHDRLAGWWIPAKEPGTRTLLYLHGNAGNIGPNAEHAVRLQNAGLNVLVVDYRGYGESTGGPPTEKRLYADAERMWGYLVQERKIAAPDVVIYGHSLGGAVAIELASRHPEAGALIVESSFTSIRDFATGTRFAYLPLNLIVTEKFDSISKVGAIRVPKLFLHGDADTTTAPGMTARLFAAAGEPKRLAIIPGGHHDDSASVNPAAYFEAVKNLLGPAREAR